MCYKPLVLNTVNPITKKKYIVPCGKCAKCIDRSVNEWAFRLDKEEQRHMYKIFITLTYNKESVPITNSGKKTLQKKDIQLFFKKLRNKVPKGTNIRYYAAGEYGTKRKRPHYHIIIFSNYPLEKYIEQSWTNNTGTSKGYIDYGKAETGSIRYALKYIAKIRKGTRRQNKHGSDDRQPEFSLKSTGLGSSFATPANTKYFSENINKTYINFNGFKIGLPRYYRKKMFDEQTNIKYGNEVNNRINTRREQKRLKHKHMTDSEYEKYEQEVIQEKTNKYFNKSKKSRSNENF